MKHLRQRSSQTLILELNEVHLWCVDLRFIARELVRESELALGREHWLAAQGNSLLALRALLSVDELQRADRYKFDLHRDRYIAARGNLRLILAHYLHIPPVEVQFGYGTSGKPHLADVLSEVSINGTRNLEFNVSHAENLAIYAIARDKAIGVDVEYKRPIENVEQLAQRFFNRQESAQLKNLSPSAQQDLFFQIWTLKEAYLKATGTGLTGLDRVQTNWHDGKLTGLCFPNCDSSWQTYQFQPLPNDNSYIAAMAIGGEVERLIEILPDV
jgi:4'-phosphopantetheinyl transferase